MNATSPSQSRRRVRAIAAVHAFAGTGASAVLIVATVRAAGHSAGPNDLGAAGLPYLLGSMGLVCLLFLGLAALLWRGYRVAIWLTALLFAGVATIVSYTMFKYSIHQIVIEATAWRLGEHSSLWFYLRAALIETLLVFWSFVVVIGLFWRPSRDRITGDNNDAAALNGPTRTSILTSPFFILGLIVWIVIGCLAPY